MILKTISEIYNDKKFFSFIRERFESEEEFKFYILRENICIYKKDNLEYINTIELTKKLTGKSNYIGFIFNNIECIISLLIVIIMPNICSQLLLMAIIISNTNIIRKSITRIYRYIKSRRII